MNRKMITILCLIPLFSFFMGITTHLFAQEKILKPCYAGEELAKVREWEKTWAGKKIDSTNVDQIKDLLPDGVYLLWKQKERFGEHWFEIVPYRTLTTPPGRTKYTKEGKCKLSPNGGLIGWVAGTPFPEPQSGIEVAWNFNSWNRGDGLNKLADGYTVDGRLKYDRIVKNRPILLQFYGRCDVPPTPEIIPNPKGLFRCSYFEMYEPTEIKGQCGLTARYVDQSQAYDTWIYIPSIRRIRRVSTAQRTDTTGGGDFCYDDNYGWDGNIQRQTYKLLATKDMLFSRHQDMNLLERKAGDLIWNGITRERIKVYVVEAICHDPGYIYAKSIWYVDPELWCILGVDNYDKYGKLWKVIDQFYEPRKAAKGYEEADFTSLMLVDVQRLHATLSKVPDYAVGIELPLGMFTIGNLDRSGR
jgi:hypothetical protein